MINRNNRRRLYSIVRNEIFEFVENKLLRKHSSRIFSLINERKLKNRKRLFDRSQSILVEKRRFHDYINKLLKFSRIFSR